MKDEFMTSPERGCAPGKANPEIFFASPKTAETVEAGLASLARKQQAVARWVCRKRCPFTNSCFAWADRNGERSGIWGGVDMASTNERDRARADGGLPAPAKAEGADAEADQVLITWVLDTKPGAFNRIGKEQQATVVREALRRGMNWTTMARQFNASTGRLRHLAGEIADSFDEQVRRQYHAGKPDGAIALMLGCHPRQVERARKRMHLPALFGPGGRPRSRMAAAQRARREQVPA